MEDNLVIPSHIQIETVAGLCNYRCNMCLIQYYNRIKGIMNNETFSEILIKLQPYLIHQRFLSFCGLGEPLIDKNIHEKIEIAKRLGFRGIGVYTNAGLLTEEVSRKLLDAKLDTLLVSIDGFTSRVQGVIRIGSRLDEIVANVECFIALREVKNSKTRILIRFTRQELNKHEEDDFYRFWKSRIKRESGDTISFYNVHNIGGHLLIKTGLTNNKLSDDLLDEIKRRKLRCSEIYERLLINSDGSISFCCGDQFGQYQIGNIFDDDPIKLYNSPYYVSYREAIDRGEMSSLELCKKCTVAYTIVTKEINK